MIYAKDDNYILYKGKMQDVIDNEIKEKIDCVITDPPYELNFMNKGWDNSGVAFQKETWERCFRVLKDGGYLLAFGGSRTYHRIACAIEDAGFEIRDCIMWLYGSGFPKSMNLANSLKSKILNGNGNKNQFKNLDGEKGTPTSYCSFSKKNIEQGFRNKDYAEQEYLTTTKVNYKSDLAKEYNGWGTALKPAYEPIIVARKPFKSSLVDNIIENGVGGLNIDECRVETADILKEQSNWKNSLFGGIREDDSNGGKYAPNELGRFPSNLILTYDESDEEEVCGGMPNTKSEGGSSFDNKVKDGSNSMFNLKQTQDDVNYHDSGCASRYFYCAKASKKDRDEGCFDLEDGLFRRMRPDKDDDNPTGLNKEGRFAPVIRKNIHPTIKPVDLMQYLVRLVAPKNATIMDCFMGSGSTGKAVMFENRERNKNYKFIGIEMTDEYLPICKARIDYAKYKYEYDLILDKKKDEADGILSFDF